MRIGLLTLTIAIVALSTSGCSSFRGWMGASKAAPDEFRVVTRAPLSMPPDYGLVAPQPGAPRPQETDVRESARQIVVDRQGGRANQKPEIAALQGRNPAECSGGKDDVLEIHGLLLSGRSCTRTTWAARS